MTADERHLQLELRATGICCSRSWVRLGTQEFFENAVLGPDEQLLIVRRAKDVDYRFAPNGEPAHESTLPDTHVVR